MAELFGEPISVYSRAQAVADGELVDVSAMAKEAGFRFPVAVTQALHADIGDIPARFRGIQSYEGRLWDCLWMLLLGITGHLPVQGDEQQFIYELRMTVGGTETYFVKAVCGPGDEGEPVITLMKPEES